MLCTSIKIVVLDRIWFHSDFFFLVFSGWPNGLKTDFLTSKVPLVCAFGWFLLVFMFEKKNSKPKVLYFRCQKLV